MAQKCLLLFSGGRDSTLAAARLSRNGFDLTLVTLTSQHLAGIAAVESRLQELKRVLRGKVEWLVVPQPNMQADTHFYAPTCLPCHHAYITAGVKLCQMQHADSIALGYTFYQSSWPEQTPEATLRLRRLLHEFGVELLLPVYDIKTRDDAITELRALRLSVGSLEQKCSQQINNVALSSELLQNELRQWERNIKNSLRALRDIDICIERRVQVLDER